MCTGLVGVDCKHANTYMMPMPMMMMMMPMMMPMMMMMMIICNVYSSIINMHIIYATGALLHGAAGAGTPRHAIKYIVYICIILRYTVCVCV